MTKFPTSIYTPRTMQNLPGLVRVPTDTKNLYAEDYNEAMAEIVAIETTLETYTQSIQDFGLYINSLTAKLTPVNNDYFIYMDSESSNVAKKISWLYLTDRIKKFLAPYFTPIPNQELAYFAGTFTGASSSAVSATSLDGSMLVVAYNDILNSEIRIDLYSRNFYSLQYYRTSSTQISYSVAGGVKGICFAGSYIYLNYLDNVTKSCYRFGSANLAGGTPMTISGTARNGASFFDGTSLLIYSTSDNFSYYTISGTTLTYVGERTFTSAGAVTACMTNGTYVYCTSYTGGTGNITKHAIAGGSNLNNTSFSLFSNAYPNYSAISLLRCNTSVIGLFFCCTIESNTAVTGAKFIIQARDYTTT